MKKGEPTPKLNGCVIIDIRGAKGLNAETINGVYEPTDEICSMWPVYRKRGDANKWLEFFAATNKWYVKATTDKGRARGWMRISCDPPCRPEACKSVCEVWDGSKWIPQSSVSVVTLKQRKEEDRIAGAQRLANAVAVDIRGATGPSASSVNGVYTPTEEICCGWPVYRKEGDPDKWLEYMITTNEWYVKPTADRGRPEGWMCLGCEPPSPPESSRGLCEVWDGEKWSVQSTVTVLTAACAFENMLEVQIFCAEETRDLQEKLNGVLNRSIGILTSPTLASTPHSTISDKSNVAFCQSLLNVLSANSSSSSGHGGGSSSSSSSQSNHMNSSSVSSLVQALVQSGNMASAGGGPGPNDSGGATSSSSSSSKKRDSSSASPPDSVCFVPAHRVADGNKQLANLLAEIDERLACLHDQAADEEDLHGDGEGEDYDDCDNDRDDEDSCNGDDSAGEGDGVEGGCSSQSKHHAGGSSNGAAIEEVYSPSVLRNSGKKGAGHNAMQKQQRSIHRSQSAACNSQQCRDCGGAILPNLPPPPPPPLGTGSGIGHAINAIPPAPVPASAAYYGASKAADLGNVMY